MVKRQSRKQKGLPVAGFQSFFADFFNIQFLKSNATLKKTRPPYMARMCMKRAKMVPLPQGIFCGKCLITKD
jgi:hypothetical protein